jgi:VWFA-related protein
MRVRKIVPIILCVIVVSNFTTSVYLQEDKKNDAATVVKRPFRVKANLMVLDESNSFVEGVKQSDIELSENGVKQKITYFAERSSGFYVAFVVDNSGSLREHLEKITTICKMIALNLGPADEAFVIRFVGRDKIEVAQDFTSDKEKLFATFEKFFIEGGQSAVVDAVYVTVEKLIKLEKTAPTKRFAVVLISDGEERNSYYNQKQLGELLQISNVQIFSIDISTSPMVSAPIVGKSEKEKAQKFLAKLAHDTGGDSYMIRKDKKEHYESVVRSLMIELRSQYIIGYESSTVGEGVETRDLLVTIADGPNAKKRKGIIKPQAILIQR